MTGANPLASRLRPVARNASVVMAWNVARLSSQLLWVLLLARDLGPAGYGAFSGLAGLGIALGGFVGLGMGLRMYEQVARDHAVLQQHWPKVRGALAWSGPALLVAYVACAASLDADVALLPVIAVGASEVLLAPVVSQLAFACAAVDRLGPSAAIPVVLSVARVGAVALHLWLFPASGLDGYALLHVATTMAAVVGAWVITHRALALPSRSARATAAELRSGLGFASLWASGLALTSVDKTAVMQAGGSQVAGEYTAGYRLASIAALPVEVLSMVIMPRVFRSGAGRPLARSTVLALVLGVTAYGGVAAWMVWLAVPFAPRLLGSGFAGLLPVALPLAIWVPAYALRLLAGNLLLGFGRKHVRIGVECAGLAALVAMMAIWLPGAGLEGAMRALVAAESAMALVMVAVAVASAGTAHQGRRA